MVDYAKLNRTATRLIKKDGRAVSLVKFADGTPADTDKPWEPGAPVPTTYATKAVFYPVAEKFVDGTSILATDETVLLAIDIGATPPMPLDLEIGPKDFLLDGTKTCAIVRGMPLRPGDTSLLLEAIVRRGA